jgi:hypothetical protein
MQKLTGHLSKDKCWLIKLIKFIDGNVHIKPGLTRMNDLKKNFEQSKRITDKYDDKG